MFTVQSKDFLRSYWNFTDICLAKALSLNHVRARNSIKYLWSILAFKCICVHTEEKKRLPRIVLDLYSNISVSKVLSLNVRARISTKRFFSYFRQMCVFILKTKPRLSRIGLELYTNTSVSKVLLLNHNWARNRTRNLLSILDFFNCICVHTEGK